MFSKDLPLLTKRGYHICIHLQYTQYSVCYTVQYTQYSVCYTVQYTQYSVCYTVQYTISVTVTGEKIS